MPFKNNNITLKESIVLLVLVAIILLLPLGLLQLFGHSWQEVSWHEASDIAMLEWSSAFFNVFLFLLLVEQFRTTQRVMYIFLSCGFLGMGIMNFVYAISQPGTESATWVQLFSLSLGSFLFLFTIPFRNSKEKFDLPRVIIKYIIPTILITCVAIWISTSLKQLLPHLLTFKGEISLFGQLLFIIPCAFFFFAAQIWLHEYIKSKNKIFLLFAVIIFIYAQMILLIRGAETWGIVWWLMHIILFFNVFIACVYMLILSIYRSLVWRLILSLGLAFSFTVLLASGIIQSYSQKQYNRNLQRLIHEQNKRHLLKVEMNLEFANLILNIISDHISNITKNSDKNINKRLYQYLLQQSKIWKHFRIGIVDEAGNMISFNPATNNNFTSWKSEYLKHLPYDKNSSISHVMTSRNNHLLSKVSSINTTKILVNNQKKNHFLNKDIILKLKENLLENNLSKTGWSSFYYDKYNFKWFTSKALLYKKGDRSKILFISIDVSRIVNSSIIKDSLNKKPNGSVVFNNNNGKILFNFIPKPHLLNDTKNKENLSNSPLLRKLIATTVDLPNTGRIMVAKMRGENYFISSTPYKKLNWRILTLINMDNFPIRKATNRYFFIAVGMLALLWGFVFLLLLLHIHLSKPLNKLLFATTELDNGNFDISVEITDHSELGVIAKTFNHMIYNMKRSYTDLSKTIQYRTEALEEVQKADAAKITFFQNISHELRTPMHGVLSFARLGSKLNITQHPEKIHKYFNNINSSAERLMIMIDSIMDLAKFESGHMKLNVISRNFILPLKQIEEEFKATCLEKDIKLSIEIPKEPIIANIDFEMMCRVYRNLIGNALKLSNNNTKIEVKIEKKINCAKVVVSDEGPGLDKDEIDHIFNKFVQGGEGSKHGGTGLGLAICREIINAHGGKIWVVNNKDHGASFIFEVPLIKEENERKTKNIDS